MNPPSTLMDQDRNPSLPDLRGPPLVQSSRRAATTRWSSRPRTRTSPRRHTSFPLPEAADLRGEQAV